MRSFGVLGLVAVVGAYGAGTLRVDTNLVLVPVTVTDAQNRSITGLERPQFRIFEDGAERPVVQFSSEDAPVSVGIVFDASGSMRDKLEKSREAVSRFIAAANPEDEFFLLEFSNHPELTVPFTTDARQIRERLAAAEPRGKTALLDSISQALRYMKGARHPRKALLVISDGGDNDSRYAAAEIRTIVRETGTWVYAIGIYHAREAFLPEEEVLGPQLLANIAEATGGRHVPVFQPAELPAAAARIGRELRQQYLLGYIAANQDGKYHRIRVKAEGRGLHVSARPGYYAPVGDR